jgi:hypothetical protein
MNVRDSWRKLHTNLHYLKYSSITVGSKSRWMMGGKIINYQRVIGKIQSKFKSEHSTARTKLEELGVHRRKILNGILKEKGVKVWPEFKWPRLGSSGWLLRTW